MTRQDQSFIEERGFIQGKCVAILFRNNTNFYGYSCENFRNE